MAKQYLDSNGLLYFWQKIKNAFVPTTRTVNGKALSANISLSASDVSALPSSTTIPTKTSDLTNDSGFITSGDIPEGSAASTTTPLMDGTASVGTEMAFARGDHRHPTDTSRVPTTRTVNGHALSANVTITASDVSAIPTSEKGAASGVCPLNASSKIDSTYLPSYVDDVIEAYARSGQTALSQNWLATESASGTVITPETGKIYVLMADSGDYAANSQFRWGGSAYVKLSDGGVSSITNAEIDTIVAS